MLPGGPLGRPRASRFCLVLACVLMAQRGAGVPTPLSLNVTATGTIRAGSSAYYTLPAGCAGQFLVLELWDTERQSNASPAPAVPAAGWQQGSLLTSWKSQPVGNVGASLQYNVTPADVLTDIRGLLYEHGYNRVLMDRRACGGASPSVSDLCNSVLCPQFSASSSVASFCSLQCRSLCSEPLSAGPLYVTVWNTGQSGAGTGNLSYSLAASCAATVPCPAPLPALGACAGVGTCGSASATAMPTCTCAGGPDASSLWGDVGCDKPLRLLTPEQPLVNQTLAYGQWAYYTFDATPSKPLQVSLSRGAGDPLLFLKNASSAPVPRGVPSLEDYYTSADALSFTSAGNTAYRLLPSVSAFQDAPGSVVAAVYANQQYQVPAVYSLLLSQAPAAACPLGCSGVGACVSGSCVCAAGWAGAACEGRLVTLSSAGGKVGPLSLSAGSWLYIAFTMPTDGSNGWSFSGGGSSSVSLQLTHTGMDPLFLARATALPTLNNFDFPVSSNNPITDALVSDASVAWQLPLSSGELWYFAVYPYPSRAHNTQPCLVSINVVVVQQGSRLAISPSFMSIILGVVLSMFLCLLMSVCKRYGMRWLMHRRHAAMWGDLAAQGIPGQPGVGAVRQRPAPPRGLDISVINSFPTIPYAEGCMRKEDANCSVCLGDYEVGETLRRLPVCTHCFHQACIDPWLAAHQTCPLCRVSLLPAGSADAVEVEMAERPRRAPQQPLQGSPAAQLAVAAAGAAARAVPPPPPQAQAQGGEPPRRQRARSEQRPGEPRGGGAQPQRVRGTSSSSGSGGGGRSRPPV